MFVGKHSLYKKVPDSSQPENGNVTALFDVHKEKQCLNKFTVVFRMGGDGGQWEVVGYNHFLSTTTFFCEFLINYKSTSSSDAYCSGGEGQELLPSKILFHSQQNVDV